VTDRKRGHEPIAMPPSEMAAAHAARQMWVSLASGAGFGRFHVEARLIGLPCDGPSVTCCIPPPLGRHAEIVLDVSDLRELLLPII
jgi:hypothetical protein